MYNPVSTYRLQFNEHFQFEDAEKLDAYFQHLGIGTIYSSPVFEAVPGSMHGYDGTHPRKINPRLGGYERLVRLNAALKQKGIGWLQDIVPNHLAYDTRNPWLFDVLEKGKESPFSDFFDIRWSSGEPLMTPFLGTELVTAVQDKVIKVIFEEGRFFFQVYDQQYPIHPGSYSRIIQTINGSLPDNLGELFAPMPRFSVKSKELGTWEEYVQNLALKARENETIKDYINTCLKNINSSFEILLELVNAQVYRLCHWQQTHKKINYRRFFTVNGLICLNIQKEKVFTSFHGEIVSLTKKGIFQGLRIDHIDGLYDPGKYLERLRKEVGENIFIVVEKILEENEVIPPDWPIQGATGYSFLATVNNLFTFNESEKQFTSFYRQICRDITPLDKQIRSRKELILYERMAGELDNLLADFTSALTSGEISYSHLDQSDIRKAIGAFLVECPVYRYYSRHMPLPEEEEQALSAIFVQINSTAPEMEKALALLKFALLDKPKRSSVIFCEEMLHFYRRLMQITGPLMAKGVEDTLMYSYNRFIGHNEVGDSLQVFGISSEEWHAKMVKRQEQHPLTMNTTSTHDTKRGEDVRGRLNVLTDIPDLWFEVVSEFRKMNHDLKTVNAPDSNDEYFVYLTLVGFYPMPGEPDDNVHERLQEYFPKALREAKLHSNWTTPNDNYEEAVVDFVISLLHKERPFWKLFSSLHRKIADFGIVNSLSQLTLKCMSPGLPDLYQGTELWDLSLVDPDNRRPVDFRKRIQWLKELDKESMKSSRNLIELLWATRFNGKIKLWLTRLLLQYRKSNSDLFLQGDYLPLATKGKYKRHVLSFLRKYKNKWVLTAVPLHLAALCQGDEGKILDFAWEDTAVYLPGNIPDSWMNIFTDTFGVFSNKVIPVNNLFKALPFAVLEGEKK